MNQFVVLQFHRSVITIGYTRMCALKPTRRANIICGPLYGEYSRECDSVSILAPLRWTTLQADVYM